MKNLWKFYELIKNPKTFMKSQSKNKTLGLHSIGDINRFSAEKKTLFKKSIHLDFPTFEISILPT